MKSHLCIFTTAAILLVSVIGCETELNSPEDYDNVQASWEIFTNNWNNLHGEGCAAIFFDDAILIPPYLLEFEGKPAISEFYKTLFNMNQSAEFNHITKSINFSKEQAIEVGSFSVNWVSNEGDSSAYRARTMVHWEKDLFGEWKIKKLLFNTPPDSPKSD